MDMLVETKSTIIHVKDATGYSVCHKCKGSGIGYDTLYHDPFMRTSLYWIGLQRRCSYCDGAAYWKEL